MVRADRVGAGSINKFQAEDLTAARQPGLCAAFWPLPTLSPADRSLAMGSGSCCFQASSRVNALMRYTIHYSSNAWLEIQWYMFGAMFLLAAVNALKHEEHVRRCVLQQMTPKQQAWLDVLLAASSFSCRWHHHRLAGDPDGVNSIKIWGTVRSRRLLRWPIKIMIPLGFLCLAVQGVAEIIKKYAVRTDLREPAALRTARAICCPSGSCP